MLLRSMKQAIYDPETANLAGVAVLCALPAEIRASRSFFAPRRKYLLAKEQGNKDNTTETGGYHYSMEECLQLGQHCSMAERRADEGDA